MRPCDDPSFFTRPPPPGRSREGGLRIDRHGRFWHHGEPITHPGMQRAFASWLARHPQDGRYILNNGYDWSYVTVEDAPLCAVTVQNHGGTPVLQLSDGTTEALGSERVWASQEGALYTLVRGGALPAKLTPAAQGQLAPWLNEDAAGIYLKIDGRRVDIGQSA